MPAGRVPVAARSLCILALTALALLAGAAPAAAEGTSLVSMADPAFGLGAFGDGASQTESNSAISADGRYVAFSSSAANLVPGDTNGVSDVFVRDTQSGTTTRVSVDGSGAEADNVSYEPSISADGRYVAFASDATNLVPGDTNYGAPDVFVRDTVANTTTRVSVDGSGAEAIGGSGAPSISADGRYVAFYSFAANLVPGDTNGTYDVFVRDTQSGGTTTRVSVDGSGAEADSGSYGPSISADGRYVAFYSDATLVPGDTNGTKDVFVRDTQAGGTTTRVSVDGSGAQANGDSGGPSISTDGRYVAFYSFAPDLVPGDTNFSYDVFVRDTQSGTTTRVSVDGSGAEADSDSYNTSISADGRYVAFYSNAANLIPGDTNLSYDVFVRDTQAGGTTSRVSVADSGAQADNGSYNPSISADGRYVAFSSDATNLVPGDSNAAADVFVRDTAGATAPAAPTGLSTNPVSPSRSVPNPRVKGSAEAFSTVTIYTNSACTGTPVSLGPATAATFNSPGISVSFVPNSTRTFYAKTTDATGSTSPCSTDSVTYTHDSIAPSAPTGLSTTPSSPSNSDSAPKVKGAAEAGSTVRIYSNATCSGTPVATGSAADFNSTGIQVPSVPNTTRTFSARATDAAGNISSCSTSSVTYTHDSNVPFTPAGLTTTPPSPSSDSAPRVHGLAEAGSTVNIYTNSTCTGTPEATGTAAAFAYNSTGIQVTSLLNATRTFYASATDAAGNVSACSTSSVTYTNDSIAPAAPTGLATTPASPSNTDSSPKVRGSGAEAGSGVSIYTNSTCTGTPEETTGADTFNSTGIQVSSAPNTTRTFYANSYDDAGNVSACSTDSVTYTHDSIAPSAAPTGLSTTPASPSTTDSSPKVKGSGAEAGSTVKLYSNPTCTGTLEATGTAAAFNSTGITVSVVNETKTFYASATDAAGNASPCSTDSVTYTHDSIAPAAPTGLSTTPSSPSSSDSAPKVKGAAEAGSTVRIYTNSTCSGTPEATGSTAADFGDTGIQVPSAPNSTRTFYASATDAVGNTSPCSTDSVTYTHDSIAPAAPTGLSTTPSSPSSDTSPRVKGTAEAGSTVRIYGSVCTGAPVASGSAADFNGAGIQVPASYVASDTTSTFRASATDAAGNVSPCSATVTYTQDSAPPSAPTGLSTTPSSPSNSDSAPKVSGTAEAGSTVKIYTNSTCTGTPEASGSAAAFNGTGIQVTSAPNSTRTLYASATDAAGNTSSCSTSSATYTHDSIPPGAPALLSPADGATIADASPAFNWSAAQGADHYELFIDGTRVAQNIAGTQATAPSPLTEGAHTWKVRAIDAAGNQADSATRSFTYTAPKPAAESPVPNPAPNPGSQPPKPPAGVPPLTKTGAVATLSGDKLDTGLILSCPAGLPRSCSGSAKLFTMVKKTRAAKRKRVQIGGYGFAIKPGVKSPVIVKLNRRGQRLLRLRRKLRVTIEITTRPNGRPATTITRVTLKLRKPATP